jgi:acetolactate synthase-1/2/3 large subunit
MAFYNKRGRLEGSDPGDRAGVRSGSQSCTRDCVVIDNGRRPSAPAGAAAIVTALASSGTQVIFGIPGGGPNLDVVGAAATAGLRFVLTHSESAATIMAATYADLTGVPGAVLVTRGPGLASAVNGIAHAALDRLPVIVIADTVRSAEVDRISHQRLDLAALGRAVAKAVVTVGGSQAGDAAADAVRLALTPPAGPVVVLMDDSSVCHAPGPGRNGPADPGPGSLGPRPEGSAFGDDLATLARALRMARRPAILLGHDAIAHTTAIRAALRGSGIPALHTYRARGIMPDSEAEAAGLVTGGTMEWPLLSAADLIIGLGVDEAEMIPASWEYRGRTMLVTGYPAKRGQATYFTGASELTMPLPAAIDLLAVTGRRHDWPHLAGRAARRETAQRLADAACAGPGMLAPQQVAATVRAHTPDDCVATVDAGAHMLAVMPLWEVTEPRRLLISSGLATMGFALPAAVAAAICAPGQPVIAFTGDGGLGMTLSEIETAVRLALRIVVIVFNDAALSLIKIKQLAAGQGGGEAVGYGPVSYARTAEAMGAAAVVVRAEAELASALAAALCRDGPTVIDALVDPAGYPMVMNLSRGEAGRQLAPGPSQSAEAGGAIASGRAAGKPRPQPPRRRLSPWGSS